MTEHSQTPATVDSRRCAPQGDAAPASEIEFTMVRDVAAFRALADGWSGLFRGHGLGHQVFQSHAWLSLWCEHYDAGRSGELAVVVGRQQGEIVVALPLLVKRVAGIKVLQWMGMPVSQYGDALAAGDHGGADCVRQGLEFAIKESGADLLWLRKVRDDAIMAPVLKAAGAAAIAATEAPYIELTDCHDAGDYLKRFSANRRKQRRRRRRRLEEQGGVTFTWLTGSEAAGREAIAAICEKRSSFQSASVLTRMDKRFENFFADYCGRRHDNDDVEPVVSRLAVGDQAVAREIGFVHNGYYVSHLGTFAAHFGGFAPGTMQMDETIAACLARGVNTFDLLAPADEYKLDFADGVIGVRDYTLALSATGVLFSKVVVETGLPLILKLRNQARKYTK